MNKTILTDYPVVGYPQLGGLSCHVFTSLRHDNDWYAKSGQSVN